MSHIKTSGSLVDLNKRKPLKIIAADNLEDISSQIVVDVEKLTDMTNHVPCSRLLSNQIAYVDGRLNPIEHSINVCGSNIDYLSSELSNTQLSVRTNVINISNLSSIVKPLIGCNVVRFKGITTTDPVSGYVTIDKIRYGIEKFEDGDVVYYHKMFVNAAGLSSTKLYAYIFANGLFNQGEVPEDGKFYKIGYGFYDNLSTNVHDDMVDDNAAIKRHKIDGLVDILDTISCNTDYLSSEISSLKAKESDDFNDLYRRLKEVSCILSADDRYLSSELLKVKGSLTGYIKTSAMNKYSQGKGLYDNDAYVPTSKLVKSEFAKISNKIDALSLDYKLDSKKYFLKSNVVSSVSLANLPNVTNKHDKVVDVDLILQLSAQFRQEINNLKNQLVQIGMLKFIALSSLSKLPNETNTTTYITSNTFDGWVYPNGARIACDAAYFKKAKTMLNQNGKQTDAYIQLPNLCKFLKMNPGTFTSSNRYLYDVPFKHEVVQHGHQNDFGIAVDSQSGSTLTATASVPTGSKATNGGLAHNGGGSSTSPCRTKINIDTKSLLNSIDLSGNVKSTGIANTEAWPSHTVMPIMMYIGTKDM